MKLLSVLVAMALPCAAMAQSSPSYVNLSPPKAGALSATDLSSLAASKQDFNGLADGQHVTINGVQQTLSTALGSISTQIQTIGGQVQSISLGALSSSTNISSLNVTPTGGATQSLGSALAGILSGLAGKPDAGSAQLTTPSNVTLKAIVPHAGYSVRRLGFRAAGDGGAATYNWMPNACLMNNGAGDNGAQVAPTSGGGCWLVDFSGTLPSPMIWGAIGTGAPGTDDTAAVQAGMTARAGYDLYLGSHSYRITSALNMPVGSSLFGDGGVGRNVAQYNLIQGTPNINVINMNLSTRVAHISIDATQVANMSGSVIHMPGNAADMFISDVAVLNGCIQFDMNGNTIGLEYSQGNGAGTGTASGCGAVRVGHETINTVTTDPRITNSVFATSAAADYGVQVEDAGGLFFSNNDVLFAKVGTHVYPHLPNQAINWLFFSNTVLGDTNVTNSFVVEPGNPTAVIKGLQMDGVWDASAGDTNVVIQNPYPGAVLSGVHFTGSRNYYSKKNGLVVIGNVSNFTVDASHFCGNGTAFTNLYISDSVSQGAVRNSEFGACDGFAGLAATNGVTFQNNNTGWIVTGNDFYGTPVPINLAPISDSIVKDNRSVDTSIQTISYSAALNLTNPTPYPNYQISGSGAITSIIGTSWFARKVLIYPLANISFVASDTICNNYTATVGVPVELTSYGRCWIIK